ncbi:uncharacterized protein J4E88_000364 [Alternaria novae-zelandiae]|uniref:uncharacterized protein n=1 Tax=Alternaria novae-zelandiae TaxID=430562 RepID=UPI0020C50D5A|nr:uncharacterized protein J4E88_000364 [Alternaria novae-zelandiae]KAI4696192.1 hypothetical protein J4E88_000364 [Alternaria novae-zelandiae]
MSGTIVIENIQGHDVSEDMIVEAAELFSSNYGIWGPFAEERMGTFGRFCKPGRPVKMSKNRLREQSLAPGTDSVLVRATVDGKLAGHAFATFWEHEGHKIGWITQLCVGQNFRRNGLATKILSHLRENKHDHSFGILSSHPATIRAALRAFGHGIEQVDLSGIKALIPAIMKSSPVPYVKMATPTGSLFDQGDQTGAVCCADTAFWVDHAEPLAALNVIKEDGIKWPFGDLPDGCEFLAFSTTTHDAEDLMDPRVM